jgi:hypothetical protein
MQNADIDSCASTSYRKEGVNHIQICKPLREQYALAIGLPTAKYPSIPITTKVCFLSSLFRPFFCNQLFFRGSLNNKFDWQCDLGLEKSCTRVFARQ